MIQKRLIVKGEKVQGVNYREKACVIARRMGIKGITKNLNDGTVEILCKCKDEKHLNDFINKLKIKGKYENDPMIEKVTTTDDKVTHELGYFNIDYGDDEDLQKELLIKIAVGDDSLKEMRTDMTKRFDTMEQKYGTIGETMIKLEQHFGKLVEEFIGKKKKK